MDDADSLLFSALRQAGCEVPEEVVSIEGITGEQIFGIVTKAVNVINNATPEGADGTEVALVTILPPNVAMRHRLCTRVGEKLKGLGYRGETGFNTLLYPNPRETRPLLQWLCEKMPKTEAETGDDSFGPSAQLNKAILHSFEKWTKELWSHPVASSYGSRRCGRYEMLAASTGLLTVPRVGDKDADRATYNRTLHRPITSQLSTMEDVMVTSVEQNTERVVDAMERELEWGSAGLSSVSEREASKKSALDSMTRKAFAGLGLQRTGTLDEVVGTVSGTKRDKDKGSAFAHAAEFGQEAAAPVVEEPPADPSSPVKVAKKRDLEEEIRLARIAVAQAEEELAAARRRSELDTSQVRQLAGGVAAERAKTEDLERAFLVRRKTLEMLPQAAKHMAELQGICAKSAKTLLDLAAEWERHRKPLIEGIRGHKEAHEKRRQRCSEMVEEMKTMRAELLEMAEQVRTKEERIVQLKEELSRMPSGVDRSQYTKRIMDTVAKVRKQNAEIRRIINDVRALQRQINFVSEKLGRTVTIANEHIYHYASSKSDPVYLESFRSLTKLRELFQSLVEAITGLGAVDNEQRDLELKCEQLLQRSSMRNLSRLQGDLKSVVAENAALETKIRAMLGKA